MPTVTNTSSVYAHVKLSKSIETESLEKNIESIMSGSLPYSKSIFKQMLSANPQNANTLYNFLLAEQNEMNVKLGTKTTHTVIMISYCNL